jgi:CheY-like chemotaxis protein
VINVAAKSVLIVDDDPQNLELARNLLVHHGYDVHTAVTAEQVLQIIQAASPRLILLDLQLPGLDGFALTRQLKADPGTRHIIIVGVTDHALKGVERRAQEAGCDGYVAKPLDTRALPAQLAAYLASRALSLPN